MSTPLLAQSQWVGIAPEIIAPTGTVTINQTPASIAVASTTGFAAAGTLEIWILGVVNLISYTSVDSTHFIGCTVASGSLSVTTASRIYGPQGTAISAPTVWIPVTGVTPEDLAERVRDESFDGDANTLRGVYDGQRDCTFDFGGMAYGDTFGHVLAMTGLADVITGAGPYVHTMKFPASANAHQPPSYTLYHYQGRTGLVKAYAGCMLDSLDVTVGAKGAVTYSAKTKGYKGTLVADASVSVSTVAPFLTWMNALTISGTSIDRLLELSYSFKRSTEGIHTQNGVQTPSRVFAGPRDLSMKAKFLYSSEGGETEQNHFLNNDQVALVATMTQPSSGPILAVTTTKAAWMKSPAPTVEGTYMKVDQDLDCVANSTDGGPWAVVLTNSVSTAY